MIAECHPVGLGDCKTLGDAAVFTRGATSPAQIISQHGHALDYGVYCSGCKPSLGFASPNPAFTWEDFVSSLSTMAVYPRNFLRDCLR